MYCRNCGEEIADNASFCHKCGKKTGNTKKTKNLKYMISIGTMLLVGIIVITLSIGRIHKIEESQSPADSQEGIETPQTMGIFGQEVEPEVPKEKAEMTLEEQFEEVFRLADEGNDTESEELFQQMYQEHSKEPELYFLLSQKYEERGKISSAKECLLEGFKQTENTTLMEQYIEISLKYAPDGNGEAYQALLRFAELYAEATDSEKKLEVAKKIYYEFMLNNG